MDFVCCLESISFSLRENRETGGRLGIDSYGVKWRADQVGESGNRCRRRRERRGEKDIPSCKYVDRLIQSSLRYNRKVGKHGLISAWLLRLAFVSIHSIIIVPPFRPECSAKGD